MADSYLDKNDQFNRGRKIRSEVLGKERVDNSIAMAEKDEFMAPFQQAATEWGWGMVWDRPGLTRQTRSMLSICLLAALDKPTELKHHIHGALNNGCTKEEIREVLLHVSVYAGMPAGLSAARAAKEFFDEHESH
ncbi:MAG: carboxymuconolactone decarboxylase family protein [Proteobacteria bacterium]|nr:carboxymuconolactone decarboxylase family protein [Pseudomonadota bacterium]